MRSTSRVLLFAFALVSGVSLLSLRQSPDAPALLVQQQLLRQSDSLITAVHKLQSTRIDVAHAHVLQQRFREVRLAYKKLEWAAEYFDPLTTRQVNGPPVPEAELSGHIIQPNGLQMIEQYLFAALTPKKSLELRVLLKGLEVNSQEFKEAFSHADLQDWQILDAAKLEVFRVEILGLNDYDDPLLRNCFAESAAALQGVNGAIAFYDHDISFTVAITCLKEHLSFDKFDRAAFIRRYGNSLSRQLQQLHNALKLPIIRYNRLLNQNAETLFDTNAYNRNAYISDPGDSVTAEKITLGKKLFFDPILSGNMTRSCASCHQPDRGFTDGLHKNKDITGKKTINRNTPTLINAALQPAQFYDMRAPSLEDQADDVVQNRDEMHGDMHMAVKKLNRDSIYRQLFNKAYPLKYRVSIDTFEVMNALASYVRSLTALNSRFDKYMQGDNHALAANEVNGFNVFMGKARCATCHYLPLFNGALPPRYMQMEAEVIGVPKTKQNKQIDPDPGMYGIQQLTFSRYAFKTTTVRNAALTAPYMHNGVFGTLEEVVDFYDKGGADGIGIKLDNQTLSTDKLHLTNKEKSDLIAFIKSLSSN
jgi:cytochrome c peroxidase